jgi:hypothetical protein
MVKTRKEKIKEDSKSIKENLKKLKEEKKELDDTKKKIQNIIETNEEIILVKNLLKEMKSNSKEKKQLKERYNSLYESIENNYKERLLEINKEMKEIDERIDELLNKKKETENDVIKIEIKEDDVEDYNSIITKIQLKMRNSREVNLRCETLKNTGKSIKNIIHMGDIHIRLSERHDIYQKIFNKMYMELEEYKKSDPETIICICGDLLHVKDKLDADTIIFTLNFLKKISGIFPTIIIPGNHDCVENSEKIDTITAILEERNLENIYYLLHSGVYVYENIIFGVSSLKDGYILKKTELLNIIEKSDIELDHNIKDIKIIGLYHGIIQSASTKNITFSSKRENVLNLNIFEDYDYILCGDIHKFQYLNKNKTSAYSGSLISQSYGETDDEHGYLIWDIFSGESKYNIIKNEYAFYDIDINEIIDKELYKEGIINISDELLKDKLDYRTSANLRVFVNNSILNYITKTKLEELIKNSNNSLSVLITLKTEITESSNILKNGLNNDPIISELKSLDEMIKNYINKNLADSELTETLINKTIEILFEIETEQLKSELVYKKSDWKILWVSYDNMFSYGKGNLIEFYEDYKNNMVRIHGANASGKTSFINILIYMLFGRRVYGYNPDILNKNSNEAKGMMIIESEGRKYLIERKCEFATKDKKRKNKHELDFYEMKTESEIIENNLLLNNYKKIEINNNKYYLVSKGTNIDTKQNYICEIIGTCENFISTSLLQQGNMNTFVLKSNQEKMKLLFEMLKINFSPKTISHINEKYQQIKKKQNDIIESVLLKLNINGKNKYTRKQQMKNDIVMIENELLPNIKKQLGDITSELSTLDNTYKNNEIIIKDLYLELERKYLKQFKSTDLDIFKKNILENNFIENYISKLKSLKKDQEDINNELINLEKYILKNQENILEEYNSINNEKITLAKQINELNLQKKILSNVNFNNTFFDISIKTHFNKDYFNKPKELLIEIINEINNKIEDYENNDIDVLKKILM